MFPDIYIQHRAQPQRKRGILIGGCQNFEASGSIDYARNYAENLTSIAKNRLTDMVRPSTARDLLVSMADWFVSRLK